MHHRVGQRTRSCPAVKLTEIVQHREGVEDLPLIGDVGLHIVNARHVERDKVNVQHLVPVLEELRDDVLSGLAAAASEADAHSVAAGTPATEPARELRQDGVLNAGATAHGST